MDKLNESYQTLPDFNKRGFSPLYASLQSSKAPKDRKQKKSSSSKSIFSALALPNMDMDPNLSFESMSFEQQKNKLRAKIQRESLEKVKNVPKIISDSPKAVENGIHEQNIDIVDISESEEEVDLPKPVSGIILNVDGIIFDVYEDVLYNILHSLNRNDMSKNHHDQDDEHELPPIECDSAFSYVRDAFGISLSKHDESLERVKAKPQPEANISNEEAGQQEFCMISPRIKNLENIEAHCALLQILLKHELETSQFPKYHWNGKFNYLATEILSMHAHFRYIDEPYTSFARWTAYTEIHQHHPLNLEIFHKLLDAIIDEYKDDNNMALAFPRLSLASSIIPACFGLLGTITNGTTEIDPKIRFSDQLKTKDENIVKLFWDSSYKMQDAFLNFIRNLHYKPAEDEDTLKIVILKNILEIVKRIDKLFPPVDIEERKFVELMKQSLCDGTIEHLMASVDKKVLKQTRKNDNRLEELIRVIKFVREHFKQFVEEFGHVFVLSYDIKFSELLYKTYDSQLALIIKPIVLEICNTKEGNIDNFSKEEEATAVKLFELYRELKAFSDYGMEAYGNYEFKTKDYFNWFSAGIDKWCKVSVFSAMSRIEKSIQLDNLKPDLRDKKYSSSAIDTVQILYSVQRFWENLAWPDSTKEQEIAKHVIGDLCRFATMYFDKFAVKVQKTEAMNNSSVFIVPVELSVTIANFSYITDSVQALVDDLTKNQKVDSSSIQKVFGNALKHFMDTTHQLINSTLKRSIPTIKKLMLESAKEDRVKEDENTERLLPYIEDMILTLSKDLPAREYEVSRQILWTNVITILLELIQSSISEGMKPEFFTDLRGIFTNLKDVFQHSKDFEDESEMSKKIERIDYLLECYGLNTSRLIHQYYKDRYEMQQEINKTPFNPYGILTVYCYFDSNILRIEILNGRNLIPIGLNRKCDSFVKIHVIPDKYFPHCQNFKTKVQQNTHFPLYDETFEFALTREQRHMQDAIIYFNIKDKYLIGSNECLAEAFLSFRDIPEFTHRDKMKQIHLTLTRLQSDELESLKAIQHRSQQGDKIAKEFLSKLRSRTLLTAKKLKIPVTQL